MTNINSFKVFTEYVANKNQAGNSLTVSQFNDTAHRAQMVIFEKDRSIFIAKQETSDFLKEFSKTKVNNINSLLGELDLPSDLEHIESVRSYHKPLSGNGFEVPVENVKGADWGKITSSSLLAGTSRFPKYNQFGDVLRYLPKNLNIITVDYFKTPVKPIWAFTTVNNRPVYNQLASIDFEWSDFAFNAVAGAFLQFVGTNLKDVELSNFVTQFKTETNSIL